MEKMAVTSKRSQHWKLYLGLECAVLFLMGINIAAFVPFFIPEAKCKGLGLTEIGVFYGFTYIFSAALYPVACYLVTKIEAKFVLSLGVIISSICTIVMGCSHWVPPGGLYRAVVYVTSLIYNVGMIQICASLFSIAPYFDPERVSFIYGCLETAYQLGQISGPLVGGFLYQLGGFPMTTIPFGVILPVVGFVVACLLPSIVIHDSSSVSNWPLRNLWHQPLAWVICYVFLATYGATSFVNALIVYHLTEFKLSPGEIGVVLFGAGCAFALSSPVVGRFNDKYGYSLVYILFGCIISCSAFFLIGPSPFVTDIFHMLTSMTPTYAAYFGFTNATFSMNSSANLSAQIYGDSPCWAPPISTVSQAAIGTSDFSLTVLAIVVISGVFLSRFGLALVLAPATRTLFEILRTPTPKAKTEDNEAGMAESASTSDQEELDKEKERSKDLNASSAVSAVYNSIMSLGGFIGLVFSGPSVENFGYPITSSILAGIIGLSAIIVGVALAFSEVKKYQTKKFVKKPIPHHHQSQTLSTTTGDEETALLTSSKEKLR